jgi:DNA invertase Pin-like site-specific DNA recombinase
LANCRNLNIIRIGINITPNKAGVKVTHIYLDHATGKKEDRPGLAACLKALRNDDVLVAPEWSL